MIELTEKQVTKAYRLMDMLFRTLTGETLTQYIQRLTALYPGLDKDLLKELMNNAGQQVMLNMTQQLEKTQEIIKNPEAMAMLKMKVEGDKANTDKNIN